MGKKKNLDLYFFYLDPNFLSYGDENFQIFNEYWGQEFEDAKDDIETIRKVRKVPSHMEDLDLNMYAWTDSAKFASMFIHHRMRNWFRFIIISYDDYYEYKEAVDYLMMPPLFERMLCIDTFEGQIKDPDIGLLPNMIVKTVLTGFEINMFYITCDGIDNDILEEEDDIDEIEKSFRCLNPMYYAALAKCGILEFTEALYDAKHLGKETPVVVNALRTLDTAFYGMFDFERIVEDTYYG